jgi:hypothetical protein
LFFLFTSVWSHTMTLSRQEGMVAVGHHWTGFTHATQGIPSSTAERATLEASQLGTHIAIVLRRGGWCGRLASRYKRL